MSTYRKKPVVIEARQWDGTQAGATPIIDWVLAGDGTARWSEERIESHDGEGAWITPTHIAIDTLEGTMRAVENDWVIRGVQGEFYPCKPDIFQSTYDVAGPDLTVDQARTQDLERQGLHGAVVRSDGLRALVELGHVADFEKLLEGEECHVDVLLDKDALGILLEAQQ